MEAASTIRQAVSEVASLRQAAQQDPALQSAVRALKAWQARRFAHTYADLLASRTYAPAAEFFLQELYSEQDFAQRDAQFARIAGGLQRLFPAPVVATAVALAQLHMRTETLDLAMAHAWLQHSALPDETQRYSACWRSVGGEPERRAQLQQLLTIGNDLDRFTRVRGLRLLLHMMRAPAHAAGLSALQRFLERGFDTFGAMAQRQNQAQQFLATIERRERLLMDQLFAPDTAPPAALAPGFDWSRV